MDRDEALKHTDHYRCTRCGRLSPLEESICTNPSCRAQLALYGEMIMAEEINKETKVTGSTDLGSSGKSKLEKPKKEKKQCRRNTAAKAESDCEGSPSGVKSDDKRSSISIVVWICISFFISLTAGINATIVYFVNRSRGKDPKHICRTIKRVCLVWLIIGLVIGILNYYLWLSC